MSLLGFSPRTRDADHIVLEATTPSSPPLQITHNREHFASFPPRRILSPPAGVPRKAPSRKTKWRRTLGCLIPLRMRRFVRLGWTYVRAFSRLSRLRGGGMGRSAASGRVEVCPKRSNLGKLGFGHVVFSDARLGMMGRGMAPRSDDRNTKGIRPSAI